MAGFPSGSGDPEEEKGNSGFVPPPQHVLLCHLPCVRAQDGIWSPAPQVLLLPPEPPCSCFTSPGAHMVSMCPGAQAGPSPPAHRVSGHWSQLSLLGHLASKALPPGRHLVVKWTEDPGWSWDRPRGTAPVLLASDSLMGFSWWLWRCCPVTSALRLRQVVSVCAP